METEKEHFELNDFPGSPINPMIDLQQNSTLCDVCTGSQLELHTSRGFLVCPLVDLHVENTNQIEVVFDLMSGAPPCYR